ncbi:NTP transferase domain-containing protein [Patescibacteria group bacterium]|nr:NTP transferase domain-containing protein [Patescibacteria group bacterium]MBU0963552.1 NTP transferase domain-containing protein [Patescibacteria group bacterium]
MDRKRLTITIKKDLLPRIDEVIDGSRIRNRSHAIEYLLSQSLGPKIKKAFILAAGRGANMRPFTYEIPKSLIPVRGKPILEYSIELLRENGLKDIYILIGHLGEKIISHFGDGSRFGVKITYIKERKEQGTGAPLRLFQQHLNNSPFLMMYGDILISINIKEIIEYHLSHSGPVTIAITSSAKPYDFGVVKLRGNKVISFREKPEKKKGVSHFINAGLFIFNPEIINYIPKQGYTMLEKDIFPQLAKEGKLFGYPFEGQWFDVGTPEIYEDALKEWKKQ